MNNGHVVEASLGYFINPLVTIAMGVLLLGNGCAPCSGRRSAPASRRCSCWPIGYGRPPWISLTLAFSFATYGLVKKKVNLGGLESLAAETAIQFLPALGYLLWLGRAGRRDLRGRGCGHAALLAATGVVTAVPLVCFGAAAIRVPLSTLGLLQYLAPVFQFLLGILYFHEAMPPERWAGFALVWLALTLLTWDALRTARRTRTQAAQLAASAQPQPASAASSGRLEPFPVRSPRTVIGAPSPPVAGWVGSRRLRCPGDHGRQPNMTQLLFYSVAFSWMSTEPQPRCTHARIPAHDRRPDRGGRTQRDSPWPATSPAARSPYGSSTGPPSSRAARGPRAHPRALEVLADLGVVAEVMAAGSAPLPMRKYRDGVPIADADPFAHRARHPTPRTTGHG